MADICDNELTVEGPAEVLAEFLRFADGESAFDFNRIIGQVPPDPDQLKDDTVASAT